MKKIQLQMRRLYIIVIGSSVLGIIMGASIIGVVLVVANCVWSIMSRVW